MANINIKFKQLFFEFYRALINNDESAIRNFLAEDVIWHETKINVLSGDLHGRDAVLNMMKEARAISQGSLLLELADVLANESHAVALINWRTKHNGKWLRGSEFAIFKITDRLIQEVWFYQPDVHMARVHGS